MRARWILVASVLLAGCDLPEDPTPGPLGGSLSIKTTTVGGDQDPDGYTVTIGSLFTLGIGVNATVMVPRIDAGTHPIALTGVADNCAVGAGSPSSVKIDAGVMAQASFAISCEPQGIEVRVRTTGADQPPEGFRVNSGNLSLAVTPNGSVVLGRLPVGTHAVSLVVAGNCSVTGSNPATAIVTHRAVVMLTFDVDCRSIERRIAIVNNPAGGFSSTLPTVFAADVNAAIVVNVVRGSGPAWSPDGKKLAYSTNVCDYYYWYYFYCNGGLWVMDMESGASAAVANREFGIDPAWSPDGSQLAFSRVLPDNGATRLQIGRTDGSPHVDLNVLCVAARHPSWSPDGQQLAFECGIGQSGIHIAVIRRDGTGFTLITADSVRARNPAWSPDGTTIAFTIDRSNEGPDVMLMTPAGTNMRLLTKGTDPAWSPDGSMVVFARGGIYRIRVDGSGLTAIVLGNYHAPAWRP